MTTLDGNAIAEVERLVQSAETVIVPDPEPRGVYYLRHPNGTLERRRVELDPSGVTLRDLESLKVLLTGGLADGTAGPVYVDDAQVVFTQENVDGTHRWQTALPLPTHPAFALISTWVKPTLIPQKDLVRLLRTQLSPYVDATVIPTFSTLNFTDHREGASSVAPMQHALDRRIVQRVNAANGQDVPESILLTPPVYDLPEDRDEEYEVKVYVEFDHDEKKFVLQVVHDDLRRARERAVSRVIAALRAHVGPTLPVLYGKPN